MVPHDRSRGREWSRRRDSSDHALPKKLKENKEKKMPPIQSKRIKWDPISFGGKTWHEISTAPQKLQADYASAAQHALERLPITITCSAPENSKRYKNVLSEQVSSGLITQAEAIALFADYEATQASFMSLNRYLGDMTPLHFITKMGNGIGAAAFQLYGIKILNQNNQNFMVSVHVWPIWVNNNPPSYDSVATYQFASKVIRGILTNDITGRSKNGNVTLRVSEAVPIPPTNNISEDKLSKEFEEQVTILISAFPDVQLVPVTRYGHTFSVYRRV
jgi:hypothetical protein